MHTQVSKQQLFKHYKVQKKKKNTRFAKKFIL